MSESERVGGESRPRFAPSTRSALREQLVPSTLRGLREQRLQFARLQDSDLAIGVSRFGGVGIL